MNALGGLHLPPLRCLQFRHDCQHLGCADVSCAQCALCQRRRCDGNFASKYLAPCDVLEAKCGAQVYVVVVDATTGLLVQTGLDDTYLQLSLVDGRRLEAEGEREEALERCQLLTNKAGQALLAHGRSGSYTDEKAVVVPVIAGQAMLPDLKVTDSSEALLTGRAPPFRLLARIVQRGGYPLAGVAPVLSEPFVVATARVKGAAKVEIPHVDDHVSKIEGLGVQTQKKLEDIGAAAAAAGIPNIQVPLNCVTKVGQFRDLVECAERNKPLRETLKQVLRLTKGWDVARDHVRKAVHTDVQLRVFHPDGRVDVGLVFKCGSYNVVDIGRPVGLLRRRRVDVRPGEELVDIIWLELDATNWPEAVKRIVPRAATAWWHEGHPGWAFLPLTVQHIPAYLDNGKPMAPMSSFSFTIKNGTAQPQPPALMQPQVAGSPAGIILENAVGQGNAPGTQVPSILNGLATLPTGPQSASNPNQDVSGPPYFVPSSIPTVTDPQLGSLGIDADGRNHHFIKPGVLGLMPDMRNPPGSGFSAPQAPSTMVPTSGNVEGSLSPFEDPAFQQLMQLVAANNPDSGSGSRAMPPQSGDSENGSKGKRKADTSLETWMALHKSLDLELDIPSNLAGIGMESLLLSAPGSGNNAKASRMGAGLRTVVGNSMSLAPSMGPGLGSSAPFADFAVALQNQLETERAAQRPRSGPAPAVQTEKTSIDASAAEKKNEREQQLPLMGDEAPARMPKGITMGQLRSLFARAVRQEIAFDEVENFLGVHGLLPLEERLRSEVPPTESNGMPEGSSAGDADQQGLDSMRSMENNLPQYR